MSKVIVIAGSYHEAAEVLARLHIPVRDRANVWVFTEPSQIMSWLPYPGDIIFFIRPWLELRRAAEYRMMRRPDRSQYTVEELF